MVRHTVKRLSDIQRREERDFVHVVDDNIEGVPAKPVQISKGDAEIEKIPFPFSHDPDSLHHFFGWRARER